MLELKSMGVINITPNSFSDASDPLDPQIFHTKLSSFENVHILDLGAESTAPMNSSITFEEELIRFTPYLDQIFSLEKVVSIDTYHPETISFFQKEWIKRGKRTPLVWNDVSGKIDDEVEAFISHGTHFEYVFCHNLAPNRELSARHMDYVSESSPEVFFEELITFLEMGARDQFIIDPCFGFSKTYEQNWHTLLNFKTLQKRISHTKWLIGISRKSFLREKFHLGRELKDREMLDQKHLELIESLKDQWRGVVWLRTHRPELISL